MMIKCDHCHHDNPDQAKFCNSCGVPLECTKHRIPAHKKAAERRQLTILFCDLVGSTPLSEHMDPEDYRQIILDYHDLVESVIQRFGGHVGNYLGDGLLVYFGYPEGLEDAPKVSIQAGLAMIKALKKSNEKWSQEGKPAIEMRIGIHTGLVVVDDHLALGETVNIAARLEGLAPPNGMVVSSQTHRLIQGWFVVKSIGKPVLKGISAPMEVFQILSESEAKSPLDIAKRRGLSPLVGRDKELQYLLDIWSKTKIEIAEPILVTGEAGIGKSRLVDALEHQVGSSSDSILMEARCSAYKIQTAFYPILELIKNELSTPEDDSDSEKKMAKLKQYLKDAAMDLDILMPLFAEYLSIHSENYPILDMSPFAKRQRIMEGFTELFLGLAKKQHLLLVFEDLHWADASTMEWLNNFFDHMPKQSVLVVGTARPGFQKNGLKHPGLRHIKLKRLSEKQMEEICLHLTHGKELPPAITEQITTKTEGVPLFVEELTKMILESDFLEEVPGGFKLAGSLSTISIPSTLQDSLLARLDKLTDVKEIVQVASVLGREFSRVILESVLPDKIEVMEKSIEKLLKADIFHHDEHRNSLVYRFKHALIRDTAYESLLKIKRQEWHHRIASVLEHQFPEILEEQPELLAHHFEESGHVEASVPLYLKAGQKASQKNATSEAIVHLEKGIELLGHIKNDTDRKNLELDLKLSLGGTFVVSHGFPHQKVKETFDEAREIARTMPLSPKLAMILFNLLSYYFNTENYSEQMKLTRYMLSLSSDPKQGYWFNLFATHLKGGYHLLKGEFDSVIPIYRRVLTIFDPTLSIPWEMTPSGYLEICSKSWLMICLQIMGCLEEADSICAELQQCTKNHSDSMTLYHVHTFPALYKLEIRKWHEAEVLLERYLPIVKAFGDPVFNLTAEVYYHIAKAYQGNREDFEKAQQLVNNCFDIGFRAFAVTMAPYIGELYLEDQQFEAALTWIEKFMNHVHKTGSHIKTSELLRIKGLALQALGKPDETIESYLQKALDLSGRQHAKTYELRAAISLAGLWQKRGLNEKASGLISKKLDWFDNDQHCLDIENAKRMIDSIKKI